MQLTKWMVVISLSVLFSGCATQNKSIAPRMDESTGEVIVTLRDALVFARQVPSLSTSASDYVYLGPVEVDVMGGQEFYLWVGVASTIDRTTASESTFTVKKITVKFDDAVMPFALKKWPTHATVDPYSVSAPLSQSLRTKVTLEELKRFSDAQSMDITLSNDLGESRHYNYWRGHWVDWTELGKDAKFGFTVEVRSRN